MPYDKSEMMDMKQNVDVCEMGCQCCVFTCNLIAFGLWTQLGTMYTVVNYDTCSVGGGTIDCEYILPPYVAEETFTNKIYKNGSLGMDYFIVLEDDSPIRTGFINGSTSSLSDDGSWVGLDEYGPAGMIVAAVLVACVGMAMRAFDKAMSYNEDTPFLVQKCGTGCLMVLSTALAGTLSAVSCAEVGEGFGLWESSLTGMSIALWTIIACGMVFAACAGCAICCEINSVAMCAMCCGGMMFIATFIISVVLVIQTTLGPDGKIDWGLSFEKLLIGAGNDCLFKGSAKVAGIKACTILALVCGIIQKICMCMFTCFSCTNSAARVMDG